MKVQTTKLIQLALLSVVWGSLFAQPTNNNNNTATNTQSMPPLLDCAAKAPVLLIADWNQSAAFVGCQDNRGMYKLTLFAYMANMSFKEFYSLPQYKTLWALASSNRLVKFELDPTGLPAQIAARKWNFPQGDFIISADWGHLNVFTNGMAQTQPYTISTDRKLMSDELVEQVNYLPPSCSHPTYSARGDFFCANNEGGVWKAPARIGFNAPQFNKGEWIQQTAGFKNPVGMAADGNHLYVLLPKQYNSNLPGPPQSPTSMGKLVRIDLDNFGDYVGQEDVGFDLDIDSGTNKVIARAGKVFFIENTSEGRQVKIYDAATKKTSIAFGAKQINPGGYAFVGGMDFLW
jgi:hypothetical protein